MEITKNALENLMIDYVNHYKRMVKLQNEEYSETNEVYAAFERGCVETAEMWMKVVGVSPNCNFIEEKLHS